ncbi:hypothetical protein KC660_01215 [Candidatus Dojkabacteria bacterium]|uniref:Uncharacterized protein n=1 Tax=Candidatus Dojkabacteria bacterium TaxID=2099670 RepID=A0A955L358_9BACT|nr:hypothetical protein [Candidatus Dojkabacteria bacterium]
MSGSTEALNLTTTEVATLLRPPHVAQSSGLYEAAVMNYLISKLTASGAICNTIKNGGYPEPVLRSILPSASPELRIKLGLGLGRRTSDTEFFEHWIKTHNHTHRSTAKNAIMFGIEPTQLEQMWSSSKSRLIEFAKKASFTLPFKSLGQTSHDLFSRPHTILRFYDFEIMVTSQPQFIVCGTHSTQLNRIADFRVGEIEVSQELLATSVLNTLAAKLYSEVHPNKRMKGGAPTILRRTNLGKLDIDSLPPYEVFMLDVYGNWIHHENVLNTRIPKYKAILEGVIEMLSQKLSEYSSRSSTVLKPVTPKIAPFIPDKTELAILASDPELKIKPKQLSLFPTEP